MGVFFSLCTLALLVYYLWAVFFDKPHKPIEIDEIKEEVIEFTFDAPIKVSEDFIKPIGSLHKQTNEEVDAISNLSDSKSTSEIVAPTSSPQAQTTSAEVEWLNFNLENTIEKGKGVVSAICNSILPSSVCGAEVEYFSFTHSDVVALSSIGHNMFSHIPVK